MGETEGTRIERPADGAVVVVLEGEHDLSTRPALEDVLDSLLEENRLVVADVSRVEFVDSTIINLLVQARRRASERQCTFRLQMGTEALVRRALEVSGVLELLECAPTRQEALRDGSGSSGETLPG